MLIEVASNLFEWLPSAQWTSTVGGKEEKWVNSSFNILFGSSDSWTIGLGRNTHVIGPDLKVIADWTYLEEKLYGFIGGGLAEKYPSLEKLKPGPVAQGMIFGTGGATDVILGDKGLLNYYGKNFTAERKSNPKFEYKDEKGLPSIVSVPLLLGFTALCGAIIAARVVYMTTRDPQHLAVRILKSTVPVLETRWVGLLQGIEKIKFAEDLAKKDADKLKKEGAILVKKSKAFANAISELSKRIVFHPNLAKVVRDEAQRLREVAYNIEGQQQEVRIKLTDYVQLIPE